MSDSCQPAIFNAYVFLFRGLAYKAKSVLTEASNDRSLSADERNTVQDALCILVREGAAKAILHIGASLSGHEKIAAAEAAKRIII